MDLRLLDSSAVLLELFSDAMVMGKNASRRPFPLRSLCCLLLVCLIVMAL